MTPSRDEVRARPLSSRNAHVAAVRTAIRRFLDDAGEHLGNGRIAVAVSGGADSLALAALTIPLAHKRNLAVAGLVVDHRLQPDSAETAETAARQLRALGADEVTVLAVTVSGDGGMEAAARRARYTALRQAADGALTLLGHTLDDQAETVLLGLGRGSGPRSIAGMPALAAPWGRPLLTVTRADTEGTCAELGLTPWADPHNVDPRFARVRLRREVLPLLEEVLQGGVAEALARTATQLREDAETLDAIAAKHHGTTVDELARIAPPIRRRVLRSWLVEGGVRDVTDAQLRMVDGLVGAWRGQGPIWLPGGFAVRRTDGKLSMNPPAPGSQR